MLWRMGLLCPSHSFSRSSLYLFRTAGVIAWLHAHRHTRMKQNGNCRKDVWTLVGGPNWLDVPAFPDACLDEIASVGESGNLMDPVFECSM